MPISHEEAKRRLEAMRRDSPRSAGRLVPGAVRKLAAQLLEPRHDAAQTLPQLLDGAGSLGRKALFRIVAPGVRGELEAVWSDTSVSYTSGYDRRPFRAPSLPAASAEVRAGTVRTVVSAVAGYDDVDAVWLARWTPHLEGWHDDRAIGRLLAAAIDGGDDRTYQTLLACAAGADEVGQMGRHVVVALVSCARPDAWAVAGNLLLAAQREEGLRQVILEAVDEAHPEAFRHVLGLVVEHGLSRFASVARAAGVWLGLIEAAGDRRRLDGLLVRLLAMLDDPEPVAAALRPGGAPEDAYLALWTMAYRDAPGAIARAGALLHEDPDPERRFAAVHLLGQTDLVQADRELLHALDDPDLRVAAHALESLSWWSRDALPPSFDRLERLLARLDAKVTDLGPAIWPWTATTIERPQVANRLALHRTDPPLDRVLPHIGAMDADGRSIVARLLEKRAAEAPLDDAARATILRFLGDPSSDVRAHALAACRKLPALSDAEAQALEPLLKRKPGDLRRGVIEQVLAKGEDWALAAAERLIAVRDAQQRLGGVDILRRVAEAGGPRAAEALERLLALGDGDAGPADAAVAEAGRRAVRAAAAGQQVTEADAFGLIGDLSRITAPAEPVDRGVTFLTPAAAALVASLDALVRRHIDDEFEIVDYNDNATRVLLGAVGYEFGWAVSGRGPDRVPELPLRDIWEHWHEERGSDLRDPDGHELLRLAGADDLMPGWRPDERALKAALGRLRVPVPDFARVVPHVVRHLAIEHPAPGAAEFLLDAAETQLARVPGKVLALRDEDWRRQGWLAYLDLLDQALLAGWTLDRAQERRLWGLRRWISEPPPAGRRLADGVADEGSVFVYGPSREPERRGSDRRVVRPELRHVARAHAAGVATDEDVLDHLAGPRGRAWSFPDLAELTRPGAGRRGHEPELVALAHRVRDRALELELARGETPTHASQAALALSHSGGLDVLVRALTTLGRDSLVRGWQSDSQSRAAVLSHLIRTSVPGPDDTPAAFAAAVKPANVPAKRLLELACFAPQWAAGVARAAASPGLEDAVWWLAAHTKDDRWDVEREIREAWEAEIASRTPLTGAQLVDGAVDVDWFWRAYGQVGAKGFGELLKAAKYGSSSGGHKRAENFARAMLGELDETALRGRMMDKRHQDSVRTLGLMPLPKGGSAAREALVLERYQLLQEFLRGSRKFGAQRQASEKRAVEIAMENLARTAGHADPIRLAWAMEARSLASLADTDVSIDDLSITLSVTGDGDPMMAVRRGEKTLKSIPAKHGKNPEVKALKARLTELRRQVSRTRASLELAMVRGDAFDGAELRAYAAHPLLWPRLSRLVLCGDDGELAGYPAYEGQALVDHNGDEHAVGRTDRLRIAHPVDLLARGDWTSWQRDAMTRKLVQPTKQVFRELYVVTDAETTDDGAGSRRYAGHQVQPARTRALLGGRGWVVTPDEGAQRTYHREHVAASLWWLGGWGSPADVEPPTLEVVRFTSTRDEGQPLALKDVPPRLFSEVMRDLDLVVSVAHVAGVDPEASQSTIEMRAALVQETCLLLGLANVEVADPRARIRGTLGDYTVHLGSATVHRMPGGSVCIVPVHAQHRGRVFLPFADDDPKSAEVLSKVLLLARDAQIKDPTILEQLRG